MTSTFLRHITRHQWISTLFVALCFVTTNSSAGEEIFRATYASEHSGIKLKLVRTLSHLEDKTYSYRLEGSGRMIRLNEESIFTINNNALIPQENMYRRKIFGIGRKEHVRFDWPQKAAYYRKGRSKHVVTHPLTGGELDASLYQLQMQIDLNTGATPLRYTYIQKESRRTREFELIGNEKFQLKGKTYDALRIRRLDENPRKQTELLVIPDLYHQIAYLKRVKDGDSYETHLTDFTFNESELKKIYGSDKIQ